MMALMWACLCGHKETASLLLDDHDANVGQAMNDGRTVLTVTCQNGHTATASLLLDGHGADVAQAMDSGRQR